MSPEYSAKSPVDLLFFTVTQIGMNPNDAERWEILEAQLPEAEAALSKECPHMAPIMVQSFFSAARAFLACAETDHRAHAARALQSSYALFARIVTQETKRARLAGRDPYWLED